MTERGPLYQYIEFCRNAETLWHKLQSGRWDWLGRKPDGQFVLEAHMIKPLLLLRYLHSVEVDVRVWVLKISTHKERSTIYIRSIKSRKYGDYFQLVRSYRDESGVVKKEVLVHLGEHETPEAALASWTSVIEDHRQSGRTEQADKLEGKLKKLRELTERKSDSLYVSL